MQHIVVFTGAGVSAESGIKTFRDTGGLWEQYRIEDVATPEAWHRNAALVQDFYNQRRKQVLEVKPNAAHKAIVSLEDKFKVTVITQNIDDLHERAGSKKVIHLHGEILKARSSVDTSLIYNINGWEIKMGEKCAKGSQLRPHIVWFGEAVPMMELAMSITQQADIFIVIGSSLEVYPAASLVEFAPAASPKYYIDPHAKDFNWIENFHIVKDTATSAVPMLVQKLLKQK